MGADPFLTMHILLICGEFQWNRCLFAYVLTDFIYIFILCENSSMKNYEMQILLLYFYIFVRYCQLHCYVTVKSVYIGGMQVNSI